MSVGKFGIGETDFSIDSLSLFKFVYITQVLPIIFLLR